LAADDDFSRLAREVLMVSAMIFSALPTAVLATALSRLNCASSCDLAAAENCSEIEDMVTPGAIRMLASTKKAGQSAQDDAVYKIYIALQ
jgi:hypothetical protein